MFRSEELGPVVIAPYDLESAGGSGTFQPSFSFAPGRDLDGDGGSDILLGVSTRHVILGPVIAARGGAVFFVRGGDLPATLSTADIPLGFGVEIDGAEPTG